MKFITLQATPIRQWSDEDGNLQSEPTSFPEITVPINEKLGFRPMWAIPITTFKETLSSILLSAINYPQVCCIFETEDYIRIDKVKHYQNIKNNIREIPIANHDLPDYLTEYCLNIESLHHIPVLMGSVLHVAQLRNEMKGLEYTIDINRASEMKFDSEFNHIVSEYINKIPSFDLEDIENQLINEGVHNVGMRSLLTYNWYHYRYSILPLILWAFCQDTKDQSLDTDEYDFNSVALESCSKNIKRLIDLDNKMAFWSREDCSISGFQNIYQNINDLIIDSEPVLDVLYTGKRIERNEKCPCKSGRKYKKCHGR